MLIFYFFWIDQKNVCVQKFMCFNIWIIASGCADCTSCLLLQYYVSKFLVANFSCCVNISVWILMAPLEIRMFLKKQARGKGIFINTLLSFRCLIWLLILSEAACSHMLCPIVHRLYGFRWLNFLDVDCECSFFLCSSCFSAIIRKIYVTEWGQKQAVHLVQKHVGRKCGGIG